MLKSKKKEKIESSLNENDVIKAVDKDDDELVENEQENDNEKDQKSAEAKKGSSLKRTAITLGVLAVLGVAGGAMYYFNGHSEKTSETVSDKQEQAVKTEKAETAEQLAKSPEERFKEKVEERLEVAKQQEANQPANDIQTAEQRQQAQAQAQEQFKEKAKSASPIREVVEMNFANARAIQAEDGTLMLVSDNGRYAFTGKVIDIWQKKELTNIDEIWQSVSTIPVKEFGLNPEDSSAMQIGQGPEHVTVFVDPLCGWCNKLVDEVSKDKELQKEYTFDFYVVPALGDESHKLGYRLYCAPESNELKIKAFLAGKDKVEALVENEKCDASGYDDMLVAAQMLGIRSVPFVVAPNGRFIAGKPSSMRLFLEESKKELKK